MNTAVAFTNFFSVELIDWAGAILGFWTVGTLLFNINRWRRSAIDPLRVQSEALGPRKFIGVFMHVMVFDVGLQKMMWDANRKRWVGHFASFWGFNLLAVSTIMDNFMNHSGANLPLDHPVRIIGNVGGVLLVFGLTFASTERAKYSSQHVRVTNHADVIFLLMIFVAAITGFASEAAVEMQSSFLMLVTYSFHLLSVGLLLGLAPFTKFVHAIGRPILLLLDRNDALLGPRMQTQTARDIAIRRGHRGDVMKKWWQIVGQHASDSKP